MIAAAASLRRLFSNHLSVPSSSRPYFHPVVNIHHRYTHAVSQPRHGNSETTKKIRQKRCDIGVDKFEKKIARSDFQCPIHTAEADATQLSSWVASASAVCIQFSISSRRLPTKIWKLNMLRIYPVEFSRVELCRRCVRARRLSWPSLQFCSQWSRPRSRTSHVKHGAVNIYLYVNSCSPEGATKLSTFSAL